MRQNDGYQPSYVPELRWEHFTFVRFCFAKRVAGVMKNGANCLAK